MSFLFQYLLD